MFVQMLLSGIFVLSTKLDRQLSEIFIPIKMLMYIHQEESSFSLNAF